MAEKLRITLGGKRFSALLESEQAPKTIAALRQVGKFTSFVFSAKICSNEITWNTPVGEIDYLENKVLEQTAGNVVFFPPWGAICVFYGPTEPAGWCTKIATIPQEELSDFIKEANKVWGHQGGHVTTEFIEEGDVA